jgi:hypothetical protein
MAVTGNGLVHEMEDEAFFEAEDEDFLEGEEEGEEFLGGIASALGGLLGEGEEEHEHEAEEEGFFEGEDFLEGEDESFLEGEEEGFLEGEDFLEGEWEDEGEAFLGGLGRLIKRAAPMLKRIAKVAAPIVGTAIGGPLGGKLASTAAGLLGEGEEEAFFEGEDFLEGEDEGEYEAHEYMTTLSHPATEAEAHAEMMAAIASGAATEAEAEAMIGAATVSALSPRERRELRRVMAHLVRGTAILTRLLRRRRITRPAVRTVPLIVHQTAKTLSRQAANGRPVTRQQAARVMARHTQRVLSSPRICTRAIARNARVARRVPVSRRVITPTARPAHPQLAAVRPAVARRVVARPAYGRPLPRTARHAYTARPAAARAHRRY